MFDYLQEIKREGGWKEFKEKSKDNAEVDLYPQDSGVSGNDFWEREREREWIIPFPIPMKENLPKIRERKRNGRKPFPKFGNGKGMIKDHSQNSGMGRE